MRWAILVVFLGCSRGAVPVDGAPPGAASAPSTPSAATAKWDGTGAWSFVTTDFHFELGGTQIVQVAEDGAVRELFVEFHPRKTSQLCADAGADLRETCAELRKSGSDTVSMSDWRVTHFALTPTERAELGRLLHAADLTAQKPVDNETGIEDGSTRTYLLRTSQGPVKLSRYQRPPPASLQPALDWLERRTKAHRSDSKPAPPAERKELDQLAHSAG